MPTIHRLEPDDWQRVRAVRLRALADAPDAFGTTLAEDEAKRPERWREQLAAPDHATFVAVSEGQDVGMAVGGPYGKEERSAGLYGMWVAPEARGTGASDLLVQAVVDWARARAFEQILLGVGDYNAPAIGLYARHGFLPTGGTDIVAPDRPHITEHERALTL